MSVPSKRVLVDSSASKMHASFVLSVPEVRQVSMYSRPVVLQSICCWHRNFLLSPRMFWLPSAWINEVNPSQPSSIIKLRFFDGPLLFFFSLRCFWHIFPSFWPHVIRPGCRLLLCQPHENPSGRSSSNIVHRVNPVHESDRSGSPSICQ